MTSTDPTLGGRVRAPRGVGSVLALIVAALAGAAIHSLMSSERGGGEMSAESIPRGAANERATDHRAPPTLERPADAQPPIRAVSADPEPTSAADPDDEYQRFLARLSGNELARIGQEDPRRYFEFAKLQREVAARGERSLPYAILLSTGGDPKTAFDRYVAGRAGVIDAAATLEVQRVLKTFTESLLELEQQMDVEYGLTEWATNYEQRTRTLERQLRSIEEKDALFPRYDCEAQLVAILGPPPAGGRYLDLH